MSGIRTRTNFYVPPMPREGVTIDDLLASMVGKYVHKIKGQERYRAQINFPNGYRKCASLYSIEESCEWINTNYDRLLALTDALPQPQLDEMGYKYHKLPSHIQ